MQRLRIERLVDYLWQCQRIPFELGVHDCALFAARWVDSELGTTYAEAVARLHSRPGFAAIRECGGFSRLIEEVTGVAPTRVESISWRPGDVGVFKGSNGRDTVGVLTKNLVHSTGAHGLLSTDALRTTHYWSLECLKR